MAIETRGNGQDIILQAFHWNLVKTQRTGTVDSEDKSWYRLLAERVDRIASLGFTIVYLPPPWIDDSAWYDGDIHGGGEGYFWRDFDLESRYGSKAELTELIAALHERGIKVIVDLVVNHRDRQRAKKDLWPYPGPCWRSGGRDTGAGFMQGDYDLNLGCPTVFERFREALEELTDDCGVDGWRWDFVWGYGVEEVVEWIRATEKTEYFSMGEYWQSDPDRSDDPLIARYGRKESSRIVGWAKDSGSCAFDVLLKREIQTANPANFKYGLNASLTPEQRAWVVTYVDNHDTGASPWCSANGWGQKHWECPSGFKSAAYAYILSMPGVPCVYWPDCFDWGFEKQISALISARQRAGIRANAEWVDLSAEHGGFAALVKDQHGVERIAISIGSGYLGPTEPEWELAAEAPGDWSVWLREF
jgi:glycosidase